MTVYLGHTETSDVCWPGDGCAGADRFPREPKGSTGAPQESPGDDAHDTEARKCWHSSGQIKSMWRRKDPKS
jgi:hypothetical protein